MSAPKRKRTQIRKLKAKYGNLTVLSDESKHGVRMAHVQCVCGTKKWLPSARLYNGNTKSCGKRGCRINHAAPLPPPPSARLHGPPFTWSVMKHIFKAAQRGVAYTELAKKHETTPFTVSYHVRRAEALGGVDKYREAVEDQHHE